eukprot:5126840-Pyramimonas_sp.AAC.1
MRQCVSTLDSALTANWKPSASGCAARRPASEPSCASPSRTSRKQCPRAGRDPRCPPAQLPGWKGVRRQFHAVHPDAVDVQAHVLDSRVVSVVHPVVALAQHGTSVLALREALHSRPVGI